MLFEKHLQEAKSISFSIQLTELSEAKSFREYILNEAVTTISSGTFDFEKFRSFVSQVSGVTGKISRVNEDCFKKILTFQTNLSHTTEQMVHM